MAKKNLKVNITADSSGLQKETKKAAKAVQDFARSATGSLSKIGSLLGADTSKVSALASAFQGAAAKIAQGAGKSSADVSKLMGTFKLVGGVIGGVAMTAGALWKAMSAEADFYGTRLEGLGQNAGLKAYQETMRTLRHDHRDGAGIAEFVARIKRGWSSIANYIQSVVNPDVDFDEDRRTAEQASFLAKVGANIAVQEQNNRVKIAEIDADIAEVRRKIADNSLTYLERQGAAAQLQGLINQRSNLELDILEKKLANTRAMNALASDSFEDLKAEKDLEVQILQVRRNQEQEIRAAQKQQKSLATELSKYLDTLSGEAAAEALDSIEVDMKIADEQALADIESLSSELDAAVEALNAQMTPIELKVDPMPLVKTMDMLPILEGGFKSAFANIGEFIGNAFSGNMEDATSQFKSGILDTLGGMAVQVGELAISTGVALAGIKTSLNTLNPYVAIAAGAALVALGSAVKSAASNLSSGMGGYASTSASLASYSGSGGSDYETRDINIKVTGTLKGDGRSLIGTIQDVEKVTRHTT